MDSSTAAASRLCPCLLLIFFFFQAEDGIRDWSVTGVQTCALPISSRRQHTSELQSLTNLVCRLLLEIRRTDVLTPFTDQPRMPSSVRSKLHETVLGTTMHQICRN